MSKVLLQITYSNKGRLNDLTQHINPYGPPFDDSLPAGWSWSNHMTLIALAKHQLDLVWDGVQVAIPFEGEIQ